MLEYAAFAGLTLDDWQDEIILAGLAEDRPDHWSSFEVAEVAPRQNGKGDPLLVVEVGFLFLLEDNGELALHTAHELKTALEHMRKLVQVINQSTELRKQVKHIRTARGSEAIELHNGKRLLFIARSEGSGRGFTGDLVVFDEAYKLDVEPMAALLPTMSSRPNPQIWYASSAPMSHSRQLHAVRRRALSGETGRLTYLEWSAGEAFEDIQHRLRDPKLWQEANPAMPHRISEEFVASELEAMSADPRLFARERLGIPDKLLVGFDDGLGLPPTLWARCRDEGSIPNDPVVFGIDVTPKRDWASVGVAGLTDAGKVHVEIVSHEPGTAWVVERMKQLLRDHETTEVVLDPRSPAGALLGDLREAGIEPKVVTTAEFSQACGQFYDDVRNGRIVHRGGMVLDDAVVCARQRRVGDEAWAWSRRSSNSDISPLVAVTLARWACRIPSTTDPQFINLGEVEFDD